jgi:hypothetical protein
MNYGIKLLEAYKAGQLSQAEIMARIARGRGGRATAERTIAEVDECRDKEFAAAEEKAGGNRALLVKLKMPTYQWHVRARTVLAVIAAGRWKEIRKEPTYALMYAKAGQIIRPTRRRTRGNRGAVLNRQVQTVERVIHRADASQAAEFLIAVTKRLSELKVPWAKDVQKIIAAHERPVLIPLPELRKAA